MKGRIETAREGRVHLGHIEDCSGDSEKTTWAELMMLKLFENESGFTRQAKFNFIYKFYPLPFSEPREVRRFFGRVPAMRAD